MLKRFMIASIMLNFNVATVLAQTFPFIQLFDTLCVGADFNETIIRNMVAELPKRGKALVTDIPIQQLQLIQPGTTVGWNINFESADYMILFSGLNGRQACQISMRHIPFETVKSELEKSYKSSFHSP